VPDYVIAETVLDIARNALLLDTNVLIAAFLSGEDASRQEYARYVLDDFERPLLVPSAVIIEAWGFIVGGRGDASAGYDLLTWLNSPGRATIVPTHRSDVQETQRLIGALAVDCVDAMLAELATNISERLELKPALPIATFDTRDFGRMTRKLGLRLSIFDMRSFDEYEIG
jgi:predicted nucleic acid-binding protein